MILIPSGAVPIKLHEVAPYVTYVYDDAAGFPATDEFRYRVTDTSGDTSNEAVVTITAKNVPAAEDDPDGFISQAEEYRTASGYSLTMNVLANDSGLLNGPVTVAVEGSPVGGRFVVNAVNSITYTADEDFTGLGGFVYRVTDADGKSDTASVQFFVFPPPVTDDGGSAIDWITLLGLGFVGLRRRLISRRAHAVVSLRGG